ncbi:hypothetical protein BDA99DRAFT_541645 [Phascolomyces articulosus]|uniref:Uncharacterized protein n=1 Tax=Phascolomyces articulosus TaxID=60185 RepID=A0AAD5JRJ2_9FUNG|nr:hypothetical protein BDA99DRAFT_541645 [Phascolomyces articulosus]
MPKEYLCIPCKASIKASLSEVALVILLRVIRMSCLRMAVLHLFLLVTMCFPRRFLSLLRLLADDDDDNNDTNRQTEEIDFLLSLFVVVVVLEEMAHYGQGSFVYLVAILCYSVRIDPLSIELFDTSYSLGDRGEHIIYRGTMYVMILIIMIGKRLHV